MAVYTYTVTVVTDEESTNPLAIRDAIIEGIGIQNAQGRITDIDDPAMITGLQVDYQSAE